MDWKSTDIIDSLKCLISVTIEKSLIEIANTTKDPPFWDDDRAKAYESAKGKAATNDEWKMLLEHLEVELAPLKSKWGRYWAKHEPRNPWDEPTGEFNVILDECYEAFQRIRPHVDTPFTQGLLQDYGDPEQSEWALLKASMLFCAYTKKLSPFPWLMGGTQLVKLKGKCGGFPRVHTVVSSMYVALKPDGPFIKRYVSGNEAAIPDEDGVANLEDEDEDDGDDD